MGNSPTNKVDSSGLQEDWVNTGYQKIKPHYSKSVELPDPEKTTIKYVEIDGKYYTSNRREQIKFHPDHALMSPEEMVEAGFNEQVYGEAFFYREMENWNEDFLVELPESQIVALGLGEEPPLPEWLGSKMYTTMDFISPHVNLTELKTHLAKGGDLQSGIAAQRKQIIIGLGMTFAGGHLLKKLLAAKSVAKNADEVRHIEELERLLDGAPDEFVQRVIRQEAEKVTDPALRKAMLEVADGTRKVLDENDLLKAVNRGMKILRGPSAPDDMVDVLKRLGRPMDRTEIGNVIHKVKKKMNIAGDEDLIFDYSGGLWDSRTGEYVGKIWEPF